MKHPIAWTAPEPFWRVGAAADADTRAVLARPQILRFANDEFIEELLATLERHPHTLPAYAAQEETWRGPMTAPERDPTEWTNRKAARLLPLIRKAKAKSIASPKVVKPAPLKLYQPAHQRHYLVAGSLVCQAPGLPDRAVDAARHRVGFVIRRLFPKAPIAPRSPLPQPDDLAQWDEYAWVLVGNSGEWQRVANAADESNSAKTTDGEERLAMFPARYVQADGHPRRLFVGSVPAGKRETYQGARRVPLAAADEPPPDARLVMFQMQVLGPWKSLVTTAMLNGEKGDIIDLYKALKAARLPRIFADGDKDANPPKYDTSKPNPGVLRSERSRLQVASWYLLLDLMLFLREQLSDFWKDNVLAGSPPTDPALRSLYDALDQAAMPKDLVERDVTLASKNTKDEVSLADQCMGYADAIEINLLAALRRAAGDTGDGKAFEASLEAQHEPLELKEEDGTEAGWPDFLFLFADPWFGILQPPPTEDFKPTTTDYLAERIVAVIDTLADRVGKVLAATTAAATAKLPEPTLASLQPADMREAWYVMRLVHERPDCEPFEASVVSRATVPFQMAGFFDPDAPARPIRIGLPIDISPAGLRKFDKNAVFMMSDMLCGQIDRFKGITFGDLVLSVLPWPFHKDLDVPDKGPCKQQDGNPLGVMCSLSIPIITICALILLMVIVSLLDFIFRWLPYFVVCFPLPNFKGRKDGP